MHCHKLFFFFLVSLIYFLLSLVYGISDIYGDNFVTTIFICMFCHYKRVITGKRKEHIMG